ncbi:MAG: phosphoenolpyruvate--protein phosphotransferase [Wenzhouxiangella sp.]|jgi:phosphotransferase system enzyme I (PtsI)|nr:phosphoenolpyruvate--protein phosphotransferase [Wenzhouxiangella sp.]
MSLALTGLGVTSGIAIGQVHRLTPGELSIPEYHLNEDAVGAELERLHKAFGRGEKFLAALLTRMSEDITDTARDLLEAHRLILRDPMLIDGAAERIRSDRINAEWALVQQADQLQGEFRRMGDEYLALRREDMEQAVGLVQRELAEQPALFVSTQVPHRLEDTIVVAAELGPAEMTVLAQRKVAGLITEHGGPWSHAAILARSLEIPMLVGVHHALDLLDEGEPVIVDGHYGAVLTGADESLFSHYREKREASQRRRMDLRRYLGRPSITRDGQAFTLLGNADLLPDFERCREIGVEAVGLMRTEYLYLDDALPDENTQYRAYRAAIEAMQGRPITIRTLDAGGDKLPAILGFTKGPNPALGLRGLRLSLSLGELFVQQIRAILRASVHGPVEILLPMLSRCDEIHQARRIIEQCRHELQAEGLTVDPELPVGGMIETPAAAIDVDRLAGHLDFLSIGTNDLIQYVLAIDRSDELVNYLYDPTHPAILFLLQRIQQAGARHNCPVTVCGELAGDERAARLLLGLGLHRLSMPPAALPGIKKSLLEASAADCREIVKTWMEGSASASDRGLLERLSPE